MTIKYFPVPWENGIANEQLSNVSGSWEPGTRQGEAADAGVWLGRWVLRYSVRRVHCAKVDVANHLNRGSKKR